MDLFLHTKHFAISFFFHENFPHISSKKEYCPKDACNFIGHLERDTVATVAMTGCIGLEDVEFTIMAGKIHNDPGTGLYKWTKEGKVEQIGGPFEVI